MKLNMEQRRIVDLEPSGHMLVKGVAGSGKTTVAIRRISFLKDHYAPDPKDSILFVTYNKTLLQYIRYQFDKLTENEEMESLFGTNTVVKITTVDSLMYRYFKKYTDREKLALQPTNRQTERQIILKCIFTLQSKYEKLKLISPKNSDFLLDEVNWIYACQIESEENYQNVDRIGRANGGSGSPQKLTKNSTVRKAIFELSQLFFEQMMIHGAVTFFQMNLLALKEAKQVQEEKFTHIIIDESQDLTKVQLEFLKCIYLEKTYSSILFVADNTQSIYSHSWLGKGRPYTTIGYDMSGKARVLSKNYRTTTEISKAAYQLIEHDATINTNIDFVKPSLIDRHGHAPIYRFFNQQEDQITFLEKEIKQLLNEYNASDICIVAKEKRLIESIGQSLELKKIECELLQSNEANFDSDKIKLVTMHSIKGLEFKVIFLVDLNDGVIPLNKHLELDDEDALESEERKLLYVGMTRANELLYMSSVKKPSKFIKELNFKDLRLKRDAQIHPFQSKPIEQFELLNQIIDPNAKEEVVRQWMISELKNTYGYPLEMMHLEKPVQQFSKKGYVDLAISIFVNGEELPYIFVEVKQFGYGIEDAVEQLKSYMRANEQVRYGVATDGIELICIDRNGEMMNDIPKCQSHFLPETKHTKLYLNFKNNKKYKVLTDIDSEKNIEYLDVDADLYVTYENKVNVPQLGDVAAGIPIAVDVQYEESVLVPQEWILSENNTFALHVTGDSMIGAGINKGDTVIVNRQQIASNGDIVIAIIDHEATMKKFMPMGDSVLLISENEKYEPIQMKKEDVLINGKVIGVLKDFSKV